jgi:outer membrane biosynthesis protein TonB
MTTLATHTHASLEAIRLKDDVIALAATMGVETEGTRADIYERILVAQDAQLASAATVSAAATPDTAPAPAAQPEQPAPDAQPEQPAPDAQPEQPAPDAQPEQPAPDAQPEQPAPDAQPEQPAPDAQPELHRVKLSGKAVASATTLVASYLGEDATALGNSVIKALEAGKQPCIVTGTGNRRFALQVFDQPFNLSDASTDVSGVCVNIARRLASRLLYPRA